MIRQALVVTFLLALIGAPPWASISAGAAMVAFERSLRRARRR